MPEQPHEELTGLKRQDNRSPDTSRPVAAGGVPERATHAPGVEDTNG